MAMAITGGLSITGGMNLFLSNYIPPAVLPGLYTWGCNYFGGLGQSDIVYRSAPTQVVSTPPWSSIGSLQGAGAAIKTDGTLWTWGWGTGGQLGLNNSTSYSSPMQVGAGTTWASISHSGSGVVGAIKTNGTLWMWGYNYGSQYLGGLTNYRSSPAQVGAANDWLKAYTAYNSFGIKTGGSLWSWGNNSYGAAGFNTSSPVVSPTQVGSLTTWSKVGHGGSSNILLKTDGTLWAMGFNNHGQLGLNDLISRSSPVQVGAGTTWSDIASNSQQGSAFLAVKTDGTLWAWGYNNYGQLGQNDLVDRSSPVQIGALTNWSKVFMGYIGRGDAFAIKTDGTLWAWGGDTGGQLGTNDSINRSSPVQIGAGTGWSDLAGSQQGIIALSK